MSASSKIELGVGFNPRYLSGELTCPADATYLEAGVSLLLSANPTPPAFAQIQRTSLHLARAPFCEEPEIQDLFVERIAARIPAHVSSIGLHLCGRFHTDLGLFGLGTAYQPSDEHEARARRFIERLEAGTGLRILLENANYYDKSVKTAARTLATQNRLCAGANRGLILDLSHLTMEAHNLGVAPELLLGMTDISKVEVVHLSGIVEGRDGAYHDGHQLPVHARAWELLDRVLAIAEQPVTVVLEHSDPRWTDADGAFAADWQRLRDTTASHAEPAPAHPIDVEKVGIGYMANVVLPLRLPSLVKQLGKPAFDSLVRAWGPGYVKRTQATPHVTAVLSDDERSFYETSFADPVADFLGDLRAKAGLAP